MGKNEDLVSHAQEQGLGMGQNLEENIQHAQNGSWGEFNKGAMFRGGGRVQETNDWGWSTLG